MAENDLIIDLDNPNYKVPPLSMGGSNDSKQDDMKSKEYNSKRPRRFSVSAEESNEHSQIVKDVVRKIYPKKPDAVERIRNSVSELFIWKGLDKEQQNSLIDAMFEKKVQKGEEVIKQGDKGDFFYVVENGTFEVWKSPDSKQTSVGAKKVFSYDGKGSFGELALLYNAPRAATIKAVTDGLLWAVDGETFRYIMISSRAKKRARFDDFLKTVDLFRNISDDVRSQIADILEVFQFEKGEYVISQGDEHAEHFYIIQNGSVEITLNIPQLQDSSRSTTSSSSSSSRTTSSNLVPTSNTHHQNNNGNSTVHSNNNNSGKTSHGGTNGHVHEKEREKYVKTLREGCYFGERALLLGCERSANVIVSSQVLRCVAMDKASFLRFVEKASVYDKIRRSLAQYTFSEKLYGHRSNETILLSPEDDSEGEDDAR